MFRSMLSAAAAAFVAISAGGAAQATPVTDFSVDFVGSAYLEQVSGAFGPAEEPIIGSFVFRADLDEAEAGIVPFFADLTIEFPAASRTATYDTSNTRVEVVPNFDDGTTVDTSLATLFIEGTTNTLGATTGDFFNLTIVLRKSDYALAGLGTYYIPQDTDDTYVATEGGLTRLDAQPVPVPAALPLLASGLGALALVRRRRGTS